MQLLYKLGRSHRGRTVLFFSLNAVRAISIISLLLLFASTIVTMVSDIRAVNHFIDSGKDDVDCSVIDCDYIECVAPSPHPCRR